MADISTGRQRGIVPFVDETTGRLPDQYLPQGVIDLQGDLEQAVSDASQSATEAKASETTAKASAESAASSKDAAARSASAASESAHAAEASKTNAAASASAAKTSETNAAASATAAQQAVDGLQTTVKEQGSKINQNTNTISQVSQKANSLEQNINSFKTTVSETYTTKTDFTNLNNAATKTYQFHANETRTGWYKLGTWSNTKQSDVCAITIYAGDGQNGRPYQNREVRVFIKDGYQDTAGASGAFGVTIDRIRNAGNAEVQVRATASDSCDVWYKGDTTHAAGRYTISIDPSSKWTHSGSFTTSDPSSGTLQTQEYQTYSTKSYVESNYVPLSTYQALEARVQALEAKLANK